MTDKRRLNEKKFPFWEVLPDNGRKYFFEIQGHHGWKARYIKEVNAKEETLRFYQEIYDSNGALVEVHDKFPEDKGHKKIKEDKQ